MAWQSVKNFLKSEDGPTAVEYCVILALIVMVSIITVHNLGDKTGESFTNSSNEIENAFSGGS